MKAATLKTLASSLFIIICATCTISSSYAAEASHNATALDPNFTEPQQTSPSYSAAEAEHLNRLYATWKAELNSLLSNIQHLALLNSTQKITPNDPEQANIWLAHMSMVINKTAQLPYAPLTPHKLVRFFTFNKTLIRALTLAYNSNLNVRPAADQLDEALEELSVALQTPTRSNLTIASVDHYARDTQQAAASLAYKISHGGLTWYNNVWRGAHSINKTLHLTEIAATTATIAALTSLVLMVIPKDKLTGIPYFSPWKEKVDTETAGLKPLVDPSTPEGRSLAFAERCVHTALLLYGTGVFTKMGQTWSDIDAYLKGTTNDSYQQLIQYVNDFTLDDPMFDSVRNLFGPFEKVLQFLKDPDYYLNRDTKPSKCILLTGTSGSGKTHSARALAGSINKLLAELGRYDKAGFIEVDPWEAGQIEEIIKRAKANAPCVVFIDELHIFAGGAQINNNAMWLSKLLTELDKIDTSNDPAQQIIIVAATNRPELLEPALLRDGRFGARIEFPVPDFEQRKSVFNALCKKSALDTTNIDLDHLARLTQGASFSTISKIFESANMFAKQQAQGVNQSHLYQALNEVLRGLNDHVNLSDFEKEVIASHLAGIALAYLTFDTPQMLDAITLQMPRRKIVEKIEIMAKMENFDDKKQHIAHYGMFYTYNLHEHLTPTTADRFVTSKLLLAGIVAQQVMLGRESSYGINDRALAFETALLTHLGGLPLASLSEKAQNDYKDKALNTLVQCEAELTNLFTTHKDQIRAIVDELKKKEFLTLQDIKTIIA